MLLSIIVPVFNVERYVDQCLNSIFSCDLRDCEVILVIGDSADGSNPKCYRHAAAHQNVRVVQQDGRGLSNARNCGFVQCSGTYVSYIDSDDFIDPAHFTRMLALLRSGREFDAL